MTQRRLLAGTSSGRPVGLARHLELHGPLPADGPDLVAAVRRAGLRGRGGAAFPTAVKIESVAAARGARELLVNAAEGDPLSVKDRVLTRMAPHLVLDGALAAARAVGARRITVAVPEDAGPSGDALGRAVDERGDRERVTIRSVPVAYLAGEESALIRHLGGGPLKPTVVPPRPAERGLRRRPTLVQNPETLAHVALIARHGPAWFREIGTHAQPGSALVTVTGAVARPGVQEIALGARIESVLERAGGPVEPLRALLVGGYHGTWVDAGAIPSLTLDDVALGRVGATLGAGIVVALGTSACPVQEVAQGVGWLAAQSAGQCGPCANGLPALARLLAAMASGTAPAGARERLARWSQDVSGRGACHLPDGAAGFVASGARVFAAEITEHLTFGPCDACRWLATIVPAEPGRVSAA